MMQNITAVLLDDYPDKYASSLFFGAPLTTVRACQSSIAYFSPNDLFAFSIWEGNPFGTTRTELYICRAVSPYETGVGVPRVSPGADLLLKAKGIKTVRAVLAWLRDLKRNGQDLPKLSPDFYKAADHRLRTRVGLPSPRPSPLEALLSP
jgi:hypothetical protein